MTATSVQTILCPVDFSDESRRAISETEELAKLFDAKVVLAHVVAPLLQPVSFAGPIVHPTNFDELAREAAEKELAEVQADLAKRGISASCEVEFGVPAKRIVALVERVGIDLVVMSTHGHTGLDHALLGSVAERVVRRCPCPVLTLKPGA